MRRFLLIRIPSSLSPVRRHPTLFHPKRQGIREGVHPGCHAPPDACFVDSSIPLGVDL